MGWGPCYRALEMAGAGADVRRHRVLLQHDFKVSRVRLTDSCHFLLYLCNWKFFVNINVHILFRPSENTFEARSTFSALM